MRSMTGSAQLLFAKVPMQIDQRFEYASVNGPDRLARIDTTRLPALNQREMNMARRDSIRAADSTRRVRVGGLTVSARAGANAEQRRRADSIGSVNHARDDARDRHMAAVADSLDRGLPATGLTPGSQAALECDSAGVHTAFVRRFATRMPVAVHIPCDLNKLIHSPDLPASIYHPGEERFRTS